MPTETEWEYAARGLNGKEYVWGDEQEPKGKIMANIWQGVSLVKTLKRMATTPQHRSVNFRQTDGLFDMGGNVWEWCSDWYMPNYYENSPVFNPKGPKKL